MKRLTLLAVLASFVFFISACGNEAEKKAEDNATATVEKQDQQNKSQDNNPNKSGNE